MKKNLLLLSILVTSLCVVGFSRLNNDLIERLDKMLFAYNQERPTTNIYVHLDKNIYMPGETVWFKAYAPTNNQLKSEGLFIRLVNELKEIVLEKEFTMYDIRSNGDFTVPDSLPQGNYKFYAYTDKMINFDGHDVFVQQIKLVSNPGDRFIATAHVIDTTTLRPGKNVEILCSLTRNARAAKNIKGSYQITTANNELIAHGKLTTDLLGNATLAFPYPATDTVKALALNVVFNSNKTTAEIRLRLPPQHRHLTINATAEGGALVDGIKGKILVETRDENGNPVVAQVGLYNGSTRLIQIITSNKGIGIMHFTPSKSKVYSLVTGNGVNKQIITFPLAITSNGWTLNLNHLRKNPVAVIHNKGMPTQATLVLRNMNQIIWHQSITVKDGDSLVVDLSGIDTIKQVVSLALFNNDGALQNERLFLTRTKDNYQVAFKIDEATYGLKQKVKVTLKITDTNGNPVESNCSVAAVSQKVLDESIFKSITGASYNLLNNPNQARLAYSDQETEFNDALIARNWWHNNWAKVIKYEPAGKLRLLANSAGVVGVVKGKSNKRVKIKPLVLISADGPQLLDVQEDGMFTVPVSYLVAGDSKSSYIVVDEGFHNKYTLSFKNYNKNFDAKIDGLGLLNTPDEFLTATKPPDEPPIINKFYLKEVKINAKAIESQSANLNFEKLISEYPSNCTDYVCMYGVLNCHNHPYNTYGGTRPGIGIIYGGIMYTKCMSCINCNVPTPHNYYLLTLVNKAKEFPMPDYEKYPTSIPQMLSTVYWNPNINTDKNGQASFEFYTSDLKGGFRIIVQGIEINTANPIFGKSEFRVE